MSSEDLLASGLGNTVGEGELEVLGEELLDVGAADVVGLLDLNNLEDLQKKGKYCITGQLLSNSRR